MNSTTEESKKKRKTPEGKHSTADAATVAATTAPLLNTNKYPNGALKNFRRQREKAEIDLICAIKALEAKKKDFGIKEEEFKKACEAVRLYLHEDLRTLNEVFKKFTRVEAEILPNDVKMFTVFYPCEHASWLADKEKYQRIVNLFFNTNTLTRMIEPICIPKHPVQNAVISQLTPDDVKTLREYEIEYREISYHEWMFHFRSKTFPDLQ